MDANANIVSGFSPNVMPQSFGDILTDEQVAALIAYIKTLQ